MLDALVEFICVVTITNVIHKLTEEGQDGSGSFIQDQSLKRTRFALEEHFQ